MNHLPGTFPNGPGPELPAELQAVQALLDRDALSGEAPPGLVARVFAASVGFLPGRTRAHVTQGWETAIVGRIPVWGRLAMAALIALAFALATRSVLTPKPSALPAMLTASEAAVLLDNRIAGTDRAVAPAGSAFQDIVATCEMTLDDLEADLAMFAADLGST